MPPEIVGPPRWTPEEDARLRRLIGSSPVALEAIVQELPGRSPAAVAVRLRRLDLSRHVDLTAYHRSRYRRYRQPAVTGGRRWMRWAPREDAMLRDAAAARISLDELQGRVTGRTSVAIVARLRALGLADRIAGTQPYFAAWAARTPKPKRRATTRRRACLRCRNDFRSAGPQNRLCDPCREFAADVSPFDIWP